MCEHVAEVHLQRDGRVFVQPYSRTTDGLWVMAGVPHVVPSLEYSEALAEAVLAALRRSATNVAPPSDLRTDPPDREFLSWVGARSFASYAKGVRAVEGHAVFDGDTIGTIRVTPEANQGARDGFVPLASHTEALEYSHPHQLGDAVQHAMSLATA